MTAAHATELADFRVRYASQQENAGPAHLRAELVASRAARAMRDANRSMDGSPRDGGRRIPEADAVPSGGRHRRAARDISADTLAARLAAARAEYADRTARLGSSGTGLGSRGGLR